MTQITSLGGVVLKISGARGPGLTVADMVVLDGKVEAAGSFAASAEADAAAALADAERAETAAQTALFGNIYADYATGLAATTIGQQWVSYGPEGSYATRWLKTAADAATAVDAYPSKSVFDAVANALDTTTIGALAVDPDGLAIGGTMDDGALIGETLQVGNLTLAPGDTDSLVLADPDGLVVFDSDDNPADLDTLQEAIGLTADADAGIDPDGLASWHVGVDGMMVSSETLQVGNLTLAPGDTDSLVLADPDGLVVFDSDDLGVESEDVAALESVYAARDAANVAYAAAGSNDLMPMVQGIVRGKVNIILTYGQSPDRSSRGYPPLTTTQPSYSDEHVYSLGQACRPTNSFSTTYGPLTSSAIYPLRAVSHNDAGTILDSAALEALGPDASIPGEGSAISATYWLRQQWLASVGLEEDATTPFILLSCGVGGQSLASLSKGASPEYYNRIISGLTQIRDHATFAGKEFSVALIKYTQGEQDYADGTGGDHPDVASYMAGVQQLRDDINADIEAIFANGQKPPAFFISQTSGRLMTTSSTNLHVGTAQLRLVTEVDGFFPVTPNFPVVNVTSAHPDNNGYRWLGQYEGRAWSQVLVHGRRPNIVYPRRATWEAATGEVIIDLCSTGGPVVSGQPWDGFTQVDLDDFGISAKVGADTVDLENVRLVGAMTIAAMPAGALLDPPLVQFGTKPNSNGYICLRCPSRQVAPEVYTFIPDAGQDPAANIPALIGKPYNLDDWCWAASIQAEEI
jgi:hypothetical protein